MATHLKALAVPLALAALLVGSVAAAATWGGGSATDLGRAAAATARFQSVSTVRTAGYGLLKDRNGVACIAMDAMPGMGAMGVHYAKSSLVADGKLDVKRPEALVYAPESNGRLDLAALEYVVLKSAWDAHHAARPVLFGHPFDETAAGNRFGLPAFYSLHVWLWQRNPSGLFSMWNPAVSCR